MKKKSSLKRCPNCGDPHMVELMSTNQKVCSNCRLTFDWHLDEGQSPVFEKAATYDLSREYLQIETVDNDLDAYQKKAAKTAVYTHQFYPWASLMIEAAELADLMCKPMLRGDLKGVDRSQIISEAGDVLWNLAALLNDQGIALSEVALYNLDKLAKRAAAGTIKGDGDR